VTDSSQPIAGWYPDPENSAAERWWDGTAWSDHRRASTVAPIPPAAPAAPAAPAVPVPPAADAGSSAGAFAAPGPAVASTAGLPAYGEVAPTPPAAPPAYGTGYGAPVYTAPPPTNSLAVVGLILGLVSIAVGGVLAALAGGIVSIVALNRARQMRAAGNPNDRHGMALAGIIVGFGLALLWIIVVVVVIVVAVNDPSFANSSSFS
jgi:hypothetical protein